MSLNVLVVENEPGIGAAAERELRDVGHQVLSCHEPGGDAFPCRGVIDPAACPLRSDAVDVALVVRSGRQARPTPREDGARCALVHRVPLVVAGDPVLDPYDEFATRTLGRTYDVVEACELAAAAPIEALSRRATEVLQTCSGATTIPGARAEVIRRQGRLRVRLLGTGSLSHTDSSRAAVRIAAALRELDPFADGIDIGTGEP